ncbi:MAG: hypothetical protein JNM09_06860 [Blastocatellia bacterium]|nr:hypothetical protein [Blastocatellia bacterium]
MVRQKKEIPINFVERNKMREIIKRNTEHLVNHLANELLSLNEITIRDVLSGVISSFEKYGQEQVKSEPIESSPITLTSYKKLEKGSTKSIVNTEERSRGAILYFRQHAREKINLMVYELVAESVWFSLPRLAQIQGASETQINELLQPREEFEQVVMRDSIERLRSLWPSPIQSNDRAYQLRIASTIAEGVLLHTYDHDAVTEILRESYEYLAKGEKVSHEVIEQQAKFSAQLVFEHLPGAVWHILCILVAASQTLSTQSIYHTFATAEDEEVAPPKPSKDALRSMSHRVLDYWLSTFDDYFKGRGRPPKKKDEQNEELEKEKQNLEEKVISAYCQVRHKTVENIAKIVIPGDKTPSTKTRELYRKLKSFDLSLADLKFQAEILLRTATGK